MQHAVHNRATIRVAERTDVSSRVTADEVNVDRLHNRIGKVCALVGATLVIPAMAYAQNQNGQGDNQLAALQAQITALQSQVNAQQTQITVLQGQVNAVLSSNVYKLNPYVSVDYSSENGVNPPNIKFTGANIHILSGSGSTVEATATGLGNLIIGYDETKFGLPIAPGLRGGSHNLVIGEANLFTTAAFGGLVAGGFNEISNSETVCFGNSNQASGEASTVCGGGGNNANFTQTVVCGGIGNSAGNSYAIVLGGTQNSAGGDASVIIGGQMNATTSFNQILYHRKRY